MFYLKIQFAPYSYSFAHRTVRWYVELCSCSPFNIQPIINLIEQLSIYFYMCVVHFHDNCKWHRFIGGKKHAEFLFTVDIDNQLGKWG